MLVTPNALGHNPCPGYLYGLLGNAGLTQTRAAQLLGLSPRQMRRYLAGEGTPAHTPAPYAVQFALEVLARANETRT